MAYDTGAGPSPPRAPSPLHQPRSGLELVGTSSAVRSSSIQLRPLYYRRPEDAVELSATLLQSKPSRIVSGVLMVEKESHQHVEGNPEMVQDLSRQRRGFLYCAGAVLIALIILVTTWAILKHLSRR